MITKAFWPENAIRREANPVFIAKTPTPNRVRYRWSHGMTDDQLVRILSCLPASEHESAKARIARAELAGWSEIGLWLGWCMSPTEWDLVGLDRRKHFGFVPGKRIWKE